MLQPEFTRKSLVTEVLVQLSLSMIQILGLLGTSQSQVLSGRSVQVWPESEVRIKFSGFFRLQDFETSRRLNLKSWSLEVLNSGVSAVWVRVNYLRAKSNSSRFS